MKPNKTQQLDDLLERYLDKEASPTEETELMDLLDEIADEHMSEGMDERLEAFIQNLEEPEAPVIAFEPRVEKGHHLTQFIRKYAIAACAALVLVIGITLHQYERSNAFTDTCGTPAEAEAQMMRALTMLSTCSQKGIDNAMDRIEDPIGQSDFSRFINFE